MVITSLENEKVKKWVKLQQKKYRDLTQSYLVEGYHLVEEALKAGDVLELIILEGEDYNTDCVSNVVSREVMKKISNTETVPPVMAVCQKTNGEICGNHILLLDDVQDPGNLGTIIRSAVAFGMDCIILSRNSVDVYNPKVLRSAQGMHHYISIVSSDIVSAIELLKRRHFTIFGTDVSFGVNVSDISADDKKRFCLVVGNEGNGVSDRVLKLCDRNLYIPMKSCVESLNVGVACSILLYELRK